MIIFSSKTPSQLDGSIATRKDTRISLGSFIHVNHKQKEEEGVDSGYSKKKKPNRLKL
jgi:hypothetical protein